MKRAAFGLILVPAVLVLARLVPGENHAKPVAPAARQFKEVAISPDGKWLAWVEMPPIETGIPTANSAIYLIERGVVAQAPRRITAGNGTTAHEEHDLAWSPDSRRMAFLSDKDKPGQLQLYVAGIADARPQKRTALTGFLAAPTWSPDGKTLALLFTENAPRVAGPLVATARDVGVIGEKIYHQRLTTVDLVGERDAECPPPQSYEFWHALKTLRVKSRPVVYPDEGHVIANPKHRQDITRRSVEWFKEHLR